MFDRFWFQSVLEYMFLMQHNLILSFFSSLDFSYAVAYDIGRNHIRGAGDWNQLRGSVEGRGRDLEVGEIFEHNKPCTEVGFWKIRSVAYATKRSRLRDSCIASFESSSNWSHFSTYLSCLCIFHHKNSLWYSNNSLAPRHFPAICRFAPNTIGNEISDTIASVHDYSVNVSANGNL